jgi:hypothetical protein
MAAESVFGDNASTKIGGVFAASGGLGFKIGKQYGSTNGKPSTNAGLCLQQLTLNAQRQVSQLYDLVSDYVYYVAGRGQCTGQLARVLGPTKVMVDMLKTLGDPCSGGEGIFFLGGAHCDVANQQKTMTSELFGKLYISQMMSNSYGINASSQNYIINESIGFQGANVKIEE